MGAPRVTSQPSPLALELDSPSVDRTLAIGRAIGRVIRSGDLIALRGDLGAGKTHLVRGLAQGMGLPDEAVASPTFVIVHEYVPSAPATGDRNPSHEPESERRPPLIHIDAYRLHGPEDLESIGGDAAEGLSEWRRGAAVAVEWADRLGDDLLGPDRLDVHIAHDGDDRRRVTLIFGGSWRDRSDVLREWLSNPQSGPVPTGDTPIDRPSPTACPICGSATRVDSGEFPFCSQRCRLVDLHRWLGGSYHISRSIEEQDMDEA